ncbi:3-hydroxyacyl-CoA dehydrogenase family protein [Nocardia brevicatena]|uniref:3-hydroxyacyl-CoA dehydrogenase family protein n=1 Tax=Nocardia brevicatena TaxID=37327 RepID=UPI000316390A|nr:3-hydroxyacyl-CoA dehydrogenase family protein [Nocardia brevicatena]
MTTRTPDIVAVIGGGRMGAGIAQVFATLGGTVTVAEAGDREAATARITEGLEAAARKGELPGTTPEEVLRRVSVVGAITHLPAEAALVVEAVPEDITLKIDVLVAAEKTVGPEAVIASNTSSLPIGELGAVLANPARFLGMHFFNPVPASSLVEIVRSAATGEPAVAEVHDWVTALGKEGIVVNDFPGFATSRLGVALGLEAIRMLEGGVADAEAIDRAMELGYRHAMGPLRSTDLVGLDVRLAIAEHLAAELGPRFEPPQLLRDKVARGELGRKTGQGFHTWNTSKKEMR